MEFMRWGLETFTEVEAITQGLFQGSLSFKNENCLVPFSEVLSAFAFGRKDPLDLDSDAICVELYGVLHQEDPVRIDADGPPQPGLYPRILVPWLEWWRDPVDNTIFTGELCSQCVSA